LTVTLKINSEAVALLTDALRTAGVELPPLLSPESGDGRER
jgi:hypothetical protein